MARVVLTGDMRRLADGVREVEIGAKDIRGLLRSLSGQFPALAPSLDAGVAIAIDGTIYQDAWLQPIAADSEVHLLPRLAGG